LVKIGARRGQANDIGIGFIAWFLPELMRAHPAHYGASTNGKDGGTSSLWQPPPNVSIVLLCMVHEDLLD
jgi:hypothetical protein